MIGSGAYARAAIHIPCSVARESATFKRGDNQLVELTRLHLINGERRKVFIGTAHEFFRQKLVEARVREEIQAGAIPRFRAHQSAFGARKKLHGTNAPLLLKLIFVASVVGTRDNESAQVKQIFRQKLAPFSRRFPTRFQNATSHGKRRNALARFRFSSRRGTRTGARRSARLRMR